MVDNQFRTRMHSSRMHTSCSLTVCCSVLPGGGVCLVRGVPGGSAWSWGGLPGPGGVLLGPRGLSLVPGGLPGPGGSPEIPPVNRITDTCKNITLATTSLRPVIMWGLLYVYSGDTHFVTFNTQEMAGLNQNKDSLLKAYKEVSDPNGSTDW